MKKLAWKPKPGEKGSGSFIQTRTTRKSFCRLHVGKQRFEYRVLIDQLLKPNGDHGSWFYLFVSKYSKKFIFLKYSELKPVEIEESHGDLEAWEGTQVELSMKLSQEVKSGNLVIEWTGKNQELRQLIPEQEKSSPNENSIDGSGYLPIKKPDRSQAWMEKSTHFIF